MRKNYSWRTFLNIGRLRKLRLRPTKKTMRDVEQKDTVNHLMFLIPDCAAEIMSEATSAKELLLAHVSDYWTPPKITLTPQTKRQCDLLRKNNVNHFMFLSPERAAKIIFEATNAKEILLAHVSDYWTPPENTPRGNKE